MKNTRTRMLKSLKAKKDADIDYSDIPPLDERFLERVEWLRTQPKERMSLRLDPDVVAWFKRQGKGYQGYINAVLKAFVENREKR